MLTWLCEKWMLQSQRKQSDFTRKEYYSRFQGIYIRVRITILVFALWQKFSQLMLINFTSITVGRFICFLGNKKKLSQGILIIVITGS